MADYIKREDAINAVKMLFVDSNDFTITDEAKEEAARGILSTCQSAAVAPVDHADFEFYGDGEWLWKCSKCGCPYKSTSHNYCCKCGRKFNVRKIE